MNSNHHKDRIKIPVAQLELGMYVAELDKDWLDSPFMYQGFIIENHRDISLLEKECEFVWIEPVADPTPTDTGRLNFTPENQHRPRYINKLTMPDEYKDSHQIFKVARERTKSFLTDVSLNGMIDTQQAQKVVSSCIDSILRNPDAMLWMSKVRESNNYTAEHCLNVCVLAIAFGRQLNLDEEELFSLGMCGLLHDVGKMLVPNEVLNKKEKLTTKEWKQMQAHVHHGRKLLMSSTGIGYTVDVAYNHHERIDGSGYPNQIPGDKLSKHTKIISITDCFDAMTAERCYSKAMTPSAAVKEIYKGRGTQFDEALALKFIKLIGLYPPGTIVEMVNGYMGIVLERNQKYQQLPKVLLLKDEKKSKIKKQLIDLELIEQGKLARDYLIKQDYADGHDNIYIADYQHFIQTLS